MRKFLIVLTLFLGLLNAKTLTVGTEIKIFNTYKYETPQEEQVNISKNTRLILVSFEKGTSNLVNEYLSAQDVMYMPKLKAVYIADIHNIPSLLASMFALPKLKEYKHLIYLQDEDEFQDFIPHQEEKVTVVHFKDKKVQSISFISTEAELKEAMEK